MSTFLDLYLFTYLSFSLFFHLGSFLGVQVTAGRDSKYLVFESFYRSSQKLSLCSTTRQPIPTMGWITCEWAVDIMTPTWLKRLCVVLAALLILSFLALGVCEMLFERTFTVKIAPLHWRVLMRVLHSTCCLGNDIFLFGTSTLCWKIESGPSFSIEAARLVKLFVKNWGV